MHVDKEPPTTTEPEVDVDLAGGVAPLDELFRQEYQPMVRVAYLLLGNLDAAEDAVQEAFAHVHARRHQLREPGAYLRRCVVNGCNDRLRTRRRRGAIDARLDPRESAPPPGDHLADAVRKLSPRRRTAVALRYYLDWSEADIAAAMGVRPGTVKALLHQGIDDLREVIEP